jgi:hypothetical protein
MTAVSMKQSVDQSRIFITGDPRLMIAMDNNSDNHSSHTV